MLGSWSFGLLGVVLLLATGPLSRASEIDSLEAVAFSGRTDTTAARALLAYTTKALVNDKESLDRSVLRLSVEVQRYREAGAHPLAQTCAELSLGKVYKMLHQPAKSIDHLYNALRMVEKLNQTSLLANVTLEIGLNYYLQRRWVEAQDFFERSLSLYVETRDENMQRVMEYLIGLCMNYRGKFEEAAGILGPLYHHWLETDSRTRVLETGTGYADALRGRTELDSAETLYRQLLEYARVDSTAAAGIFIRIYSGLSHVLYDQGKHEQAIEVAETAMDHSVEREYFFPQLEALEVLYKSYREMQTYDSALVNLERLTRNLDSLQGEQTNVRLGIARVVFDQEKQQAALLGEEARKRQILIAGIILAGVMIVITGLFYRSLSKQKARSEALLANILPRETIVELKTSGVVKPRIHKNVTILFCDIEGFTRIAETLSPQELVKMLDTYITAFDEIVRRHGLEKIKTIGDAYMVAGGLHEDPIAATRKSLTAALEMIDTVEMLREPSNEQFGFAFSYRIGIHTGNVISGMVGRDKYAYDIWGDAVNVASRMERHSEPGKVNISADTNEIVRHDVATVYRGEISVKNKGEVGMYFVHRG